MPKGINQYSIAKMNNHKSTEDWVKVPPPLHPMEPHHLTHTTCYVPG